MDDVRYCRPVVTSSVPLHHGCDSEAIGPHADPVIYS
jgi:hypothetical protein